ncbi:MAG TPA: PH domain-containing protein [Pseudonocardiaceae bacterium]|nr:PH domain-containing protein [Pseudonocardiaceae bacterium]
MDEPVPPTAWSPSPALIGTTWVLAVATLAYTVFSSDPIGRLVTGIATIGLIVFALFGTIARPRLAVDADGIEVRRMTGRQRLPWGSVRISVSSTRRLGREVSLLELDTDNEDDPDGGLIVLGWLDLGTEPEQVAAALRSYWR